MYPERLAHLGSPQDTLVAGSDDGAVNDGRGACVVCVGS